MTSPEHERLIEKLRRIEALYADRAATPGERAAASEARERLRQRLSQTAQADPPVEYTFRFHSYWSKKLFIALLRRYSLRPYRYARQRHTTVMARVPARFVKETLWPEFTELDHTLRQYLTEITDRVIAESIHGDASDVEVRSGQALSAGATQDLPGDDP